MTIPVKSASYSRDNFLPDISKISHLDSDNIRLLSTDSSCFRDDSLSDGTLVLTSPDDEKLGAANGSSGTPAFGGEPCDASEESYIYAVSRACEAFMSRVGGSQRRKDANRSAQRTTKEASGSGLAVPQTPQGRRPTRRHAAICGSEAKENSLRAHDYVNSAIIALHFGEKRKRGFVSVMDLSRNAGGVMNGGSDLRFNAIAAKDLSVLSMPTKRRKVAEISFSLNGKAANGKKDKDATRKRTSWRASFRRVFRARETGSSSGDERSLVAPETRPVENCQQRKFGLVDRMKGLRLGIRNSFSVLTKKDKRDQ